MGKFMKTVVSVIAVAALATFCNFVFGGSEKIPDINDGWFGRGPSRTDLDESIRPFTIQVGDDLLNDIKYRLEHARLGEDLANVHFQYGFRVSMMRKVIDHWLTKFDWRQQEAILNSFPHYRTNIEGIDIHFIHITPSKPSGRVLLMSHGWPGSVWEFHKVLPLLAEAGYEVVCPSIPGFGYSEAAHQPGMNYIATARIYTKLMSRLGHERFYLQGGDWGGFICTSIAMAYPQKVVGLHLNFFQPPTAALETSVKQILGSFFPSLLGISEWEYSRAYPLSELFVKIMRNSGYMHIQATKPDTIAFGLNDSPVGLAAYILEKFGSGTDGREENLDSDDGLITAKFTMDELLTNVMIYYTTGSIGSSMRFYKENLAGFPEVEAWQNVHVTVPTGLASYPNELSVVPRAIAEIRYKNIRQYTMMPRGGHFAALEDPQLLLQDFNAFVKLVEQ